MRLRLGEIGSLRSIEPSVDFGAGRSLSKIRCRALRGVGAGFSATPADGGTEARERPGSSALAGAKGFASMAAAERCRLQASQTAEPTRRTTMTMNIFTGVGLCVGLFAWLQKKRSMVW